MCDGLSTTCALRLELSLAVAPGLLRGSSVEVEPIEDVLADLTNNLGLPEGALALDSVRPAADGATSGGRRLLAASPRPKQGPPVPVVVPLTLAPSNLTSQPTAAWVAAALGNFSAGQPADAPVKLGNDSTVERVGTCGNGICETGERSVAGMVEGSCPADCGPPSQPCPGACAGRGTCVASSGTCNCFARCACRGWAGGSGTLEARAGPRLLRGWSPLVGREADGCDRKL